MEQKYIEELLRVGLQKTATPEETRLLLARVLADEEYDKDTLLNELRQRLSVDPLRAVTNWMRNILDAIETLNKIQGPDSAISDRLLRVRSLITDEVILVIRRDRNDIKKLKAKCDKEEDNAQLTLYDVRQPDRPDVCFDIEFKSEFKRRSERYREAFNAEDGEVMSLVVQCLFVVRFNDRVFFTLHDRSFTGAEDNMSRYSLITGRLSVTDLGSSLPSDARIRLSTLCQNGLQRILHKSEELGLSAEKAHDYVTGMTTGMTPAKPTEPKGRRTQFIGVFEDKKGRVLSCLYAIFITPDEYDEIVRRGPYLIPVTPHELTSLRALGLLNDILHANSCNSCTFDKMTPHIDLRSGIATYPIDTPCRSSGSPCIVRAVGTKLSGRTDIAFITAHTKDYQGQKILRNGVRTNGNAVIISLDIPEYPLSDAKTISLIRDQLLRLIQVCLPLHPTPECGYRCHVQTTPQGYIIILQKAEDQHADRISQPIEANSKEANIALVAYFFSIYMLMKLATLRTRQEISSRFAGSSGVWV